MVMLSKRKLLRLGFVAPRHIAGRPGFNEETYYRVLRRRFLRLRRRGDPNNPFPLLFALSACQKANAHSLLNALGAYPV